MKGKNKVMPTLYPKLDSRMSYVRSMEVEIDLCLPRSMPRLENVSREDEVCRVLCAESALMIRCYC